MLTKSKMYTKLNNPYLKKWSYVNILRLHLTLDGIGLERQLMIKQKKKY